MIICLISAGLAVKYFNTNSKLILQFIIYVLYIIQFAWWLCLQLAMNMTTRKKAWILSIMYLTMSSQTGFYEFMFKLLTNREKILLLGY